MFKNGELILLFFVPEVRNRLKKYDGVVISAV